MTLDPARTTIRQVAVEGGQVSVTWGDGHCSRYHSLWLRRAHERARPAGSNGAAPGLAKGSDSEIGIAAAEVTPEGDLEVTWQSDSSTGRFEAPWLREHCYSATERGRRRRPLHLWDASIAERLPQSDYVSAQGDETARLAL